MSDCVLMRVSLSFGVCVCVRAGMCVVKQALHSSVCVCVCVRNLRIRECVCLCVCLSSAGHQ